MAKKPTKKTTKKVRKKTAKKAEPAEAKPSAPAGRPSAELDTRVVYCGDCLDKLADLPDNCVDLISIDPPFNSDRNQEVFGGDAKRNPTFGFTLYPDNVGANHG